MQNPGLKFWLLAFWVPAESYALGGDALVWYCSSGTNLLVLRARVPPGYAG